jgi:EAL domain-containing protein (putative c-di-GMP-specific phosphodiesterase class I)
MAEIAPTLDEIVAPGFLRVLFQPVLRLRFGAARLHSVEALVQGPSGSLFESPALLSDFARRKCAEPALDRASVRLALSAAGALPPEVRVAVAAHAATLHRDLEFGGFLCDAADAGGIAVSRLTLGIVGPAPGRADDRLREALDGLRRVGVRVGLDDLGEGHSSFRTLLDVRPDEVKLDRYLLGGCAADPFRRAIVAAIAEVGRRFGAEVVAEGVETADDLAAARDLGIELFQGQLFFPALQAGEYTGPELFGGAHGAAGAMEIDR